MARILLVDPPGWQEGLNVGLMYLAGSLHTAGHQARIVDFNNAPCTREELFALIREYRPDALGYSLKTATYFSAVSLATATHEAFPDIPHLAGGPHVTMFWRQVLDECPMFDVLALGDAERTIESLLPRIAGKLPLDGLTGIAYRAQSGPVETGSIRDAEVDSMSYPDLRAVHKLDLSRIRYPLVTSRGCPYNCSFCSVPVINGKKFRARSPQSVIGELRHMRQELGLRQVEVLDDTFTQDMDRCRSICDALIEARLDIEWACPNGIRADRLDEDLVTRMYRAGCREVMLGIESANPPAFKLVTKGETLDDIRRAIAMLKDIGMVVGGFFIIGLPGDNYEGVLKSLDFVRESGLDRAVFNVLNPYPGTRVYEQVKQRALYIDDFRQGTHFSSHVKPTYDTPEFPAADMVRAFWVIHTKLRLFEHLIPWTHSRPRRIIEQIGMVLRHDRENLPGYLKWLVGRGLSRIQREWEWLSRAPRPAKARP